MPRFTSKWEGPTMTEVIEHGNLRLTSRHLVVRNTTPAMDSR